MRPSCSECESEATAAAGRRPTFGNLEPLQNCGAAAVTSAASAAAEDVEAVVRADASAEGHDEGRHGPASHDGGSLP